MGKVVILIRLNDKKKYIKKKLESIGHEENLSINALMIQILTDYCDNVNGNNPLRLYSDLSSSDKNEM